MRTTKLSGTFDAEHRGKGDYHIVAMSKRYELECLGSYILRALF
jgi:hypothetical protein